MMIDMLAVIRDIVLWPGRWLEATIEVATMPTKASLLLWIVVTVLSAMGLWGVAADAFGSKPSKINTWTLLLAILGGVVLGQTMLTNKYPLDLSPVMAKTIILSAPGVILWGRIIGAMGSLEADEPEYNSLVTLFSAAVGGLLAYALYASGVSILVAGVVGIAWVAGAVLGGQARITWYEARMARLRVAELLDRKGAEIDEMLERYRERLEERLRKPFKPKF